MLFFEDRTESILKHANIDYKNNKGYSLKLSEKLNKIKSRKEFQDKYIQKHITQDLIMKIEEWKNEIIYYLDKWLDIISYDEPDNYFIELLDKEIDDFYNLYFK